MPGQFQCFCIYHPLKPPNNPRRKVLQPSIYRRSHRGLDTLRKLPKVIRLIVSDDTGMEFGLSVSKPYEAPLDKKK